MKKLMTIEEATPEMTKRFLGDYFNSTGIVRYRELRGGTSFTDYKYHSVEYETPDSCKHDSTITYITGNDIQRFVGDSTEVLIITGETKEMDDTTHSSFFTPPGRTSIKLVPVILMRKYIRQSHDASITGFIMESGTKLLIQEELGQLYYQRICFETDGDRLPFFRKTDDLLIEQFGTNESNAATFVPHLPEDFKI